METTYTAKKEGAKKMPVELVKVKQYRCYRCDYTWIPRSEDLPVTCPKCRSPYWNKPKKAQKDDEKQ